MAKRSQGGGIRRGGADALARASAEAVPEARPGGAGERFASTRYDLRVFQALRRIIRALDLQSRRLSAQHRITGPQLVCLHAIGEFGPVTLSAIARHVHLSPSTVIGIIDRIEAKGLVRRARDSTDRRLVFVSLTDGGRALVAAAPSPVQDTLAKAMSRLPEPEQAGLAGAVERIVEMMEARDIEAAPILASGSIGAVAGPPREPVSPQIAVIDPPVPER